jgi:hypothetical protein
MHAKEFPLQNVITARAAKMDVYISEDAERSASLRKEVQRKARSDCTAVTCATVLFNPNLHV